MDVRTAFYMIGAPATAASEAPPLDPRLATPREWIAPPGEARRTILDALAQPLPAPVRWIAVGQNGKGTRLRLLAHWDARDYAERLDDILGADRWSASYEIHGGTYLCFLSMELPDENGRLHTVTKTDADALELGGIEPVKSAISGSFKRAAGHAWGVGGRVLYKLGDTWVNVDPEGENSYKLKDGTYVRWNPPPPPDLHALLDRATVVPEADVSPPADDGQAPPPDGGWPDEVPSDGPTLPLMLPGEDPVCPKCGGAMWDNRPSKRKGQFLGSPDLKCKSKTCGHKVHAA